jgi:hypothetical protein
MYYGRILSYCLHHQGRTVRQTNVLELLVSTYDSTRFYNQKDLSFSSHRRQNLKRYPDQSNIVSSILSTSGVMITTTAECPESRSCQWRVMRVGVVGIGYTLCILIHHSWLVTSECVLIASQKYLWLSLRVKLCRSCYTNDFYVLIFN